MVKEVMEALKRRDAEIRIPVLRMELDYQLAILYEAMQQEDSAAIEECKHVLSDLRKELLLLEA